MRPIHRMLYVRRRLLVSSKQWGSTAETTSETPELPVQNGFPACEENLGGATAAGRGEIAFVEKTITESEITETIEVDVLVCGQGPAGMAAALACAEKGLHTVAVEKGASPTWRSATMGAFHDRVHEKFGVTFDTKQWLDDAMVNCSYRGEQTNSIRSGSIPAMRQSTGSWMSWMCHWKTIS